MNKSLLNPDKLSTFVLLLLLLL